MTKPPDRKQRSIGLRQEADATVKGQAPAARDARQPFLPLDPMPERIEPCLALLVSEPPEGDDWAFEIKWDGYRLAIHVDRGRVRILTRGGHDWTSRFPGIASAAQALDATTLILDGEAVVLDDHGRSDFGALQKSLGGRGGKRSAHEAVLYAFDLLYLDGIDTSRMALVERRHLLEDVLGAPDGAIRLSEEIDADGATLLRSACEHGLEGIIAKHRERPYRSGRGGDWLKIKCVQSESFAIVGYEPSRTSPGALGSLLLAARSDGAWVHVGAAGTGFSDRAGRELKAQLDLLRTTAPAVSASGRKLVFARPELVAEIAFRGWTGEGKLRHAAFKGLRDAADRSDVFVLGGKGQ